MVPPPWAFEIKYYDPQPHEDLICSICQSVFCDPVESNCCHVFCKKCIIHWLFEQPNCPVCRKRSKISSWKPAHRVIRNVIKDLTLSCKNFEEGCNEKMTLQNCENHIKECSFEKVMCENLCGNRLLRRDIEKHKQEECYFGERMHKVMKKVQNHIDFMKERLNVDHELNRPKFELEDSSKNASIDRNYLRFYPGQPHILDSTSFDHNYCASNTRHPHSAFPPEFCRAPFPKITDAWTDRFSSDVPASNNHELQSQMNTESRPRNFVFTARSRPRLAFGRQFTCHEPTIVPPIYGRQQGMNTSLCGLPTNNRQIGESANMEASNSIAFHPPTNYCKNGPGNVSLNLSHRFSYDIQYQSLHVNPSSEANQECSVVERLFSKDSDPLANINTAPQMANQPQAFAGCDIVPSLSANFIPNTSSNLSAPDPFSSCKSTAHISSMPPFYSSNAAIQNWIKDIRIDVNEQPNDGRGLIEYPLNEPCHKSFN